MEPKKVTISGLPLHGNAFGWGGAIQIDMRILLAIAPTMYRQTLAHSIRRECPNDDVCLADPDALDREASSFHPHMIVCNDSASEVQEVSIPSWVVIRYHDSLSASVFLDGKTYALSRIYRSKTSSEWSRRPSGWSCAGVSGRGPPHVGGRAYDDAPPSASSWC